MKQWRKLAALCLVGIMVFALAACQQSDGEGTQKPTESQTPTDKPVTPSGEGVSVNESLLPNIDPKTYKEFIGIWYADGSSAGYRINVKDTGTWELTDASEEVVSSGSLRVNEEEESLEMYDPDGSLAITVSIEEEGVLHADIMLESLTDSLSTNYFYNKITNDISDAPPVDIEDTSSDVGITDDTVVTPPVEEEITD